MAAKVLVQLVRGRKGEPAQEAVVAGGFPSTFITVVVVVGGLRRWQIFVAVVVVVGALRLIAAKRRARWLQLYNLYLKQFKQKNYFCCPPAIINQSVLLDL